MGAIEELEKLKDEDLARYRHSIGVFNKVSTLLKKSTVVNSNSHKVLMQASLLHDIGYRKDISVVGFHPYDGYVYLTGLGYDRDVCLLVLHHSLSEYEAERHLLNKVYKANPVKSQELKDLLYILNYADWNTSDKGEPVTFKQQMDKGMLNRLDEINSIIHYVETKLCAS